MSAIWKYPLTPEHTLYGSSVIRMPKGAEVLTVQMVRGIPVIYVRIDDPSEDWEERRFVAYPTGAT